MLARFLRRLRYQLARDRRAADLAEEMEFHRALSGGRGMGNMTLAREDAWDIWSFGWVERAWRDAIYGLRALRREPVFAVTVLVTLSLGITATTTVFSVADAELWRPLPFPQADRLVRVYAVPPGPRWDYKGLSGPDFLDWRAASRLATYAGERDSARQVLRRGAAAEWVRVLPVTDNFFDVLGRAPRIGRGFHAGDEHLRAAILSDTGWRRLYDSDPAALGRQIALNGESLTIVGIAAGQYLEYHQFEPDLFTPIDMSAPALRDRSARTLSVVGRMAPGVDERQAQAELDAIAGRIATAFPADHAGYHLEVSSLQQTWSNARPLYFFLIAAAIVLALSCANATNLLLARALRRQREFAIRGALGGGRAALIRQLVVEAALLAAPSAVAGLTLSLWALRLFASSIPEDYLLRGGHFTLDPRVAVFVLFVSGITTLSLSLAPLLFSRRLDLNAVLGQGARSSSASVRQVRIRSALLTGQLTMTVVLMAAAGLFTSSFVRLTRVPLGFTADALASAYISLGGTRYNDDASRREFADRLLERARAMPGVSDAAIGSSLPLGSGPVVKLVPSDRPRPSPDREPSAIVRAVDPGYFRTLGIRLVSGRPFAAADLAGAPRVTIVNEYLASLLFPGESAVGRRVELSRARTPWTNRPGQLLIVGVAGNIKDVGINEVEFGNLYLPFDQAPASGLDLVVRTSIPVAGVADVLRGIASDVDPDLPASQLTTLAQRVDEALQGDRLNMLLIAGFAAIAIVLAAVGIFGAMACAVQERTREFGVRLALGQQPRAMVRATLWESVRFGVVGGTLGLAIALVVARLLGNALYLVRGEHPGLLYGVTTTDPVVLGGAAAALILIATLSGVIPARQVSRVDPLIALRAE
jgi:putative ABC transport system permease protein